MKCSITMQRKMEDSLVPFGITENIRSSPPPFPLLFQFTETRLHLHSRKKIQNKKKKNENFLLLLKSRLKLFWKTNPTHWIHLTNISLAVCMLAKFSFHINKWFHASFNVVVVVAFKTHLQSNIQLKYSCTLYM